MKKQKFLLAGLFVLCVLSSHAQIVEKGDNILNFGFGIGNNYTAGGSEFSNSFVPVSASFEIIINDDLFNDGKGALGIGGYVAYMNYKYASQALSGTFETFGVSALKSAASSASGE